MNSKFDERSQKAHEKATRELDAYGRKAYALDEKQEESIQILPDDSVSPAKFKAHAHLANTFIAHPLTIRAMKKDIFILGDDIEFHNIECIQCSKHFEKECWNLCPYCGADIGKDSPL